MASDEKIAQNIAQVTIAMKGVKAGAGATTQYVHSP